MWGNLKSKLMIPLVRIDSDDQRNCHPHTSDTRDVMIHTWTCMACLLSVRPANSVAQGT